MTMRERVLLGILGTVLVLSAFMGNCDPAHSVMNGCDMSELCYQEDR